MEKINLQEKINHYSDYWNPRNIVALNSQHVKLAKFQGPFTWHHHKEEDELFLVVKGAFTMEFRDRNVMLTIQSADDARIPVVTELVEFLLQVDLFHQLFLSRL